MTMKKLLVAAALIAGGAAWGATEVVDGITWTYTVANGQASVGQGGGRAIPDNTAGAITIPSTLGGCPVTGITYQAFECCTGMTSVTISSSITRIGNLAFIGCSALTAVTIPRNVTSIGHNAFAACTALKYVTIPKSVTSIGDGAFGGCDVLATIAVDSQNPNYKSVSGLLLTKDGTLLIQGVNRSDITIPSGVTDIGKYAFLGYAGIKSVTMPDGVANIRDNAFCDCSALTAAMLPPSVTNVGSAAFSGCGAVRSVAIPACVTKVSDTFKSAYASITNAVVCPGVTSLGSGALAFCSKLESVEVPASVTNIGRFAFQRCNGLKNITFGGNAPTVGWYPLDGIPAGCTATVRTGTTGWDDDGDGVWHGLKLKYVLPSGGPYAETVDDITWTYCLNEGRATVTGCSATTGELYIPSELGGWPVANIGEGAFSCRSGLTSVAIPPGVTDIGDFAFSSCTGLRSVYIPSGVTSIGEEAFAACDGLDVVILPSTVATVGPKAFYTCRGLRMVTIPEGVRYVGNGAFAGCALTSVEIPSSVTNLGWYAFGDLLTSVTLARGLASIGDRTFYECNALTSVTIPSSVAVIGDSAFYGCGALQNVIFGGNAPTVGSYAFSSVKSGCTATVYEGTAGWDDDGDGKWNGLKLVWRKNPIPDLGESPTKEEIAAALGGAADAKLAKRITNGENYDAFRAWAGKVTNADGTAAGAPAVKDAPNAWLSFALGSETLIAKEPEDGDVKVESFEPAADGSFEFTVSVKDIAVGKDAAAENLKQVFGITGGASLENMTAGGVDIEFGAPVDGKVKFTAKPKSAGQSAYFMRVGMEK